MNQPLLLCSMISEKKNSIARQFFMLRLLVPRCVVFVGFHNFFFAIKALIVIHLRQTLRDAAAPFDDDDDRGDFS